MSKLLKGKKIKTARRKAKARPTITMERYGILIPIKTGKELQVEHMTKRVSLPQNKTFQSLNN